MTKTTNNTLKGTKKTTDYSLCIYSGNPYITLGYKRLGIYANLEEVDVAKLEKVMEKEIEQAMYDEYNNNTFFPIHNFYIILEDIKSEDYQEVHKEQLQPIYDAFKRAFKKGSTKAQLKFLRNVCVAGFITGAEIALLVAGTKKLFRK